MDWIVAILTILLYIVVIAIVFYAVIWVLGQVGITIPPRIMQLIVVAFALVVLIWLVTALVGGGTPPLPSIRLGD